MLLNALTLDQDGLIVQRDGDGGDCAARTGELYTLLHSSSSQIDGLLPFPYALKKLWVDKVPLDALLRYTKPPYNDPRDCSRDQTIPLIIAAGFYASFQFLRRVEYSVRENNYRFQNGDLCSPEHYAVMIRAHYLNRYEVTPSRKRIAQLWLGDAFNLLNTVIRVVKSHLNHDDVGDCINHTLICYQAALYKPTLFSKLSRFLFSKLRYKGVQYAFDHYHRPESGGNPLNELARFMIEVWFK